jgi:hypothetical protein
MPGRHDRESDYFGPELEGTIMDTTIESFVFKEGNKRSSGENAINWTLNEEERIMFSTGGYGITFNRMRCLLRPQNSEFKYTSLIA